MELDEWGSGENLREVWKGNMWSDSIAWKNLVLIKKSEMQKERPIDILNYSENLENKLKVLG